MKTKAFKFLVGLTIVAAAALAAVQVEAQSNSGGNSSFASASIADATGVVTTVTTNGTFYTVGTAAPLVAGPAGNANCITYSLATNRFTVVSWCGAGVVELEACLNDVVGANNATVQGAWHRVRAAVSTVAGPTFRDVEGATAARGGHGCVKALVSANVGDTYDFRYTSGVNGETITTRAALFSARKLSY
jgi:hypothetical protein